MMQRRWQQKSNNPVVDTILRHIASFGYTVRIRRGEALAPEIGAFVEMHATDEGTDPPVKYIARIGADEGGDTDFRCACLLANVLLIDLGD